MLRGEKSLHCIHTCVWVCVNDSQRSSPFLCICSLAGVSVSPSSSELSLSLTQRLHCNLTQTLLLFDADEQILFDRKKYGWGWNNGPKRAGWSCIKFCFERVRNVVFFGGGGCLTKQMQSRTIIFRRRHKSTAVK